MEIDLKRFKLFCEGRMLYNGIMAWIAHAILAMLIQQEQLCLGKIEIKIGMGYKESKKR
ncbi:hypothetical protein ACQZOR_05080 [Lactobacillus delbrueckii subsp. bulgaricus]|uniref:hypothetical protein n=1 Tax=Lactobacillus delbrueckii TaxID=1584 RepID=UPI003D2EB932